MPFYPFDESYKQAVSLYKFSYISTQENATGVPVETETTEEITETTDAAPVTDAPTVETTTEEQTETVPEDGTEPAGGGGASAVLPMLAPTVLLVCGGILYKKKEMMP